MRLINRHPAGATALFLGLVPFLLVILVYGAASQARLAENPTTSCCPASNR